ncbi:cupin domain-containing protein [Streptomyces kanamyceticus]|uniref:Cupin domain-containing protein n=1 Tax=Streptomyces kanamyceticus TaxID=1967 RepID=A0A5J6GMN2_STRKN|nr:cupin domain-containing protein [Streptomyces kanamyceticus]QEU96333.1 cupin domain-containing protein [Streptomyces kanamyceticus]
MGHDSRSDLPFTSTVVAEGFDRWSPPLHQEFAANSHNDQLGQTLLKKTEQVRVWETHLAPGERLPVHRHERDYTWIALTDGHARQHSEDGASREISFARGQTLHFRLDEGRHHLHDLKNIGEEPLSFLTVETQAV